MTTHGARIFGCPYCGYGVSGFEVACPSCGGQFTKNTKFECPICGSPVTPTMATCPSCEIDLKQMAAQWMDRLWDKAIDKISEDLDQIEKSIPKTAVCPKCSGPLDAPGAQCPKCARAAKEPPAVVKRPPEPPIDELADEEEEDVVCPICGAVVGLTDETCGTCGAEFEAEEEVEPEISPEPEPVRPAPLLEVAEEEELEEDYALCPVCNGAVSLTVSKCPHCGVDFEEEEEEEIPVAEQLVETGLEERDQKGGILSVASRQKQVYGTGISNGTVGVNGVGVSNGRSLVNGVHWVNGIGAVNGRDLINGQGAMNGTGIRSRGRPQSRRAAIMMKWKLLAVLAALVIILPVFMYISFAREKAPYEIDGNFDDWGDTIKFGTATISTSPTTNVIEWSVDTYESELFVYVRTEGNPMSTESVEELTLFIDSDCSTETGYDLRCLGADLKLDIRGWNSSVTTSTLSVYDSSTDNLDWSGWNYAGAVQSSLAGSEIEAKAKLPSRVNGSSRLVLASLDEDGASCTSYPVVLGGSLLVVEQMPALNVLDDGLLEAGTEMPFMRLRFTCEGEGGTVSSIEPAMTGIDSFQAPGAFSLNLGEEQTVEIEVDSSTLAPGSFVAAQIAASGITSTFSEVHIIGEGVRAYVEGAPSSVVIDGAFADWAGKLVSDYDVIPIVNEDIDIAAVGVSNNTDESFFYVSVYGDICSGSYVPKILSKPSGTGGGVIVPTRKTAEDFLRVYIDSDQSQATGSVTSGDNITIGADYMIEISGLLCEIMSTSVSRFTGGDWTVISEIVDAAIDERRMEIGVVSSLIGGGDAIDYLIVTTDWSGARDVASNESMDLMTKGWIVDSTTTSELATALSVQRKLFYDGANYWSFYYDGSNTMYRYSDDGGATWSSASRVFPDYSGVADVSIWYDAGKQLVYAVGDRSTPSQNVYLQRGVVDPSTPSITWAGSDSTLAVSPAETVGGKNAFICKDANGYLWILSSRQTGSDPDKFDLVVYISDEVDSISDGWTEDITMLSPDSTNGDLKGSILPMPTGSGSDVWAVYNHDSHVDARKCTSGSWGSEYNVYTDTGSLTFMNTAPASALIDDDGVLHVVFGDATKSGQTENPQIRYRYCSSGGWSSTYELDDDGTTVAHRYPTISLDNSTGDLYAFWISLDDYSIDCKKNDGDSWDSVTLSQNGYTKQYLTSIYNVSGANHICWQWTQNTSSDIEVIFDVIPEFEEIVIPVFVMMAIFFVGMWRRRTRTKTKGTEETE